MTLLPVLVEVPVNHAAIRPIPEQLRQRLDVEPARDADPEQRREDSARLTARSQALREAHLQSVKEKAARETQRAEEAAERKRALAEAEAQKVLAKLSQASQRMEHHRQEQHQKREEEKARRQALADAVVSARARADIGRELKGREEGLRTSRASERANDKVAAVSKRSSDKVKSAKERGAAATNSKKAKTADEDAVPLDEHLLGTGEQQAETDRGNDQPLHSPHPIVLPLAGGLRDHGLSSSPASPTANGMKAETSQSPRQSPRRGPSPQLPSIREGFAEEAALGDPVSHQQAADELSDGPKTMINETLSAITSGYDADGLLLETPKASRAFERCFFKMEARSPGKTKRCYEIAFPDGSTRRIDM